VVLGVTGDNFGAGFTGGMAFVYDADGMLVRRINRETLTWNRIGSAQWEARLRGLIEQHALATNSRYAAMLLHDWMAEREKFWHIVPKEYAKYVAEPLEAQVALRA
jgi:glutamate synthase (NADPH/NADH) large chain